MGAGEGSMEGYVTYSRSVVGKEEPEGRVTWSLTQGQVQEKIAKKQNV